MAKEQPKTPEAEAPPPGTSEKDKAKARKWFEKAENLRGQKTLQSYDYAIESFISGLAFWPDGIEEGYLPLWSLAIQRSAQGGKKPGMMESMKLNMLSSKDAKGSMLKALSMLARDPSSAAAADAVLKFADKAEIPQAAAWAADKSLDSMRKDAKPNAGRFKFFREALVSSSEKAAEQGDHATAVACLEIAMKSLDYQISRTPGDMALKDEMRHLGGKLTIAKGNYQSGDDFRSSLKDADAQKVLHDSDRAQQGEQSLQQLIKATQEAYRDDPQAPIKINAYVEALLKLEHPKTEAEAIRVLEKAAVETDNYNFQLRADDIRLRQAARQRRQLERKAAQTGAAEDAQNARLALLEEQSTTIRILEERVKNYPTDAKHKTRLGEAYFHAGRHDDAIPMLQASQNDPRVRFRALMFMGRAFFEKQLNGQAVELLNEAIESYERSDDDLAKEMRYWRARALESEGQVSEAKNAYGQLLRIDYNYADARDRLDQINKKAS